MGHHDDLTSSLPTNRMLAGIDVADDDEAIRFRFVDEDDPVVWQVEGDCCSSSYWYEGLSLNALRDSFVANVASLDLPQPGYSEYEDIKAYGYAIVTDKGL